MSSRFRTKQQRIDVLGWITMFICALLLVLPVVLAFAYRHWSLLIVYVPIVVAVGIVVWIEEGDDE